MERKYLQFEVLPVDEHSPINKYFFARIMWFNGEDIICTESNGEFTDKQGAYKWIAEKLKENK